MPNLTAQEITRAINKLPAQEKIKIAEKLQDFVSGFRVQKILRRIDVRKATRPTTREILKEIHACRSEKHAQSRH